MQKKMTASSIAAAAIGLPLLSYVFAGESAAKLPPEVVGQSVGSALPVETFVLGSIAVPAELDSYRGVVAASKEAELSFRRGGRVESIEVEEGSVVTKGLVLASLDATDVEAQVAVIAGQIIEADAMLAELVAGPREQTIEAARNDVQRLEAVASLAAATAERQRFLIQSNSSSRQQYDEARFAVQQNEAALAAAKQNLSELVAGTRPEKLVAQRARLQVLRAQERSAHVDLDDARIVAPFSGIIAKRLMDEGTIAHPQAIVLRLIQCEPLEATFGLAVKDAMSLSIGHPVKITVNGLTRDAVVARIEPELDRESRTQAITISLPGAYPGIVPGQTASLSISRRRENGLWVPISALSRAARGLWSLYVVVQAESDAASTSIIERRDVQVVETDTTVARIVGSMVTPGDRVVRNGIHRVTPGMRVTPIAVSPPGAQP